MTPEPISARLAALQNQLPQLIADHPDDAEFWPAFAGIADEIQVAADAVSPAVGLDVYEYIDTLLQGTGKRDGDERPVMT